VPKKQTIGYIVVFNVLIIVAYVFSSIYLWDFLSTQINQQGGRQENGIYIIPFIQITGLQLTVGHDAWTSDGIVVPTALPISVPNYLFMVFWIAIIGNLIFMAVLLRKLHQQ